MRVQSKLLTQSADLHYPMRLFKPATIMVMLFGGHIIAKTNSSLEDNELEPNLGYNEEKKQKLIPVTAKHRKMGLAQVGNLVGID